MYGFDLRPIEKRILEQSSDLDATRKRKKIVMLIELVAAIFLAAVACIVRSWQLILLAALAYIFVTVFEKMAYSDAILAYKGLIQKLKRRIEELESKK